MKDRDDLAEVIASMTYSELMDVAAELHDMNAGENEGLRTKDKHGMAETLSDWAEAAMEEKAERDRAKAAEKAAAKAA
jgi:hypothetical protein